MNQRQTNNAQPAGPVVDWPVIVFMSAGLPIELIFHDIRTFGVRSIGSRATIALLMMALFVGFHPNDNPAPLGFFMLGTVLLSVLAFAIGKIQQWRGVPIHSRYTGRPYLMWFLRFLSESTVKRIEPLIVFVFGVVIHCVNSPLGSFLMVASVCLGLRVMFERIRRNEQALDINDALIEQSSALQSTHRFPGR
jgi:hypothetical protein